MPTVNIRAFVSGDYNSALAFWSNIDGLGLNESDTPEAAAAFLIRNRGFSAIAIAATGEIVGAVLCGQNVRAGSPGHLAVAKSRRGRGIGSQLVEYAFTRLAEAKIPRCNIFVYNDNHECNRFWRQRGWSDPSSGPSLTETV